MTWFRCGGIPVTLKNAMNAVLNKKFGTSTTYDPSGWPADVNLMGPLPVKSASGAIASFSDGADGVPVKSCTVSFLPSGGGGSPSQPVSIQGVSGLAVTQLGKNLLKLNDGTYTYFSNNLSVSISNGKATITGTTTASGGRTTRLSNVFLLKAGDYIISPRGSDYSPYIRVFINKASDNTSLGYNSGSKITIAEDVEVYIGFSFEANVTYNVADFAPQIEVGSTATTYSAYVTPSVVTDTFGQTIYGGTRDLTTDKASAWSKITLDENGSYGITAGTTTNRINVTFYNTVGKVNGSFASEKLKTGDNTSGGHKSEEWVVWGSTSASRCWISVPLSIDTVDKFKTFLQSNPIDLYYETETPVYVTGLTPHEIDTLLGDNNIYADTGNTSVEYRADIDLALNALQGSRSLSASLMRSGGPDLEERSEDPEEVSELEENIQNTEEQEGENDAR